MPVNASNGSVFRLSFIICFFSFGVDGRYRFCNSSRSFNISISICFLLWFIWTRLFLSFICWLAFRCFSCLYLFTKSFRAPYCPCSKANEAKTAHMNVCMKCRPVKCTASHIRVLPKSNSDEGGPPGCDARYCSNWPMSLISSPVGEVYTISSLSPPFPFGINCLQGSKRIRVCLFALWNMWIKEI